MFQNDMLQEAIRKTMELEVILTLLSDHPEVLEETKLLMIGGVYRVSQGLSVLKEIRKQKTVTVPIVSDNQPTSQKQPKKKEWVFTEKRKRAFNKMRANKARKQKSGNNGKLKKTTH